MARIPYGARPIENPVGTALGFIKVLDDVNKAIIVLPGVPAEMKPMLEKVFEYLGLKETKKRLEIIRTFGLMELDIEEKIKGVGEYILNATPKGVDIFLIDRSGENLNKNIQKIKEKLGKYIYGFGEIEMEEVVGKLLIEKRLTISTAESSTGGLISSRIINVSGASRYMLGSIVAYSNEIKEKILGVKRETLENFGAVSKETAKEMVLGAKKIFNSDIALSDTGIAGPTGGTEEKPVGLHYVGFAYKDKIQIEKVIFKGERNDVRMYISQYALNLVRLNLLN
jgi:nicotinamide-nucleotide amidase